MLNAGTSQKHHVNPSDPLRRSQTLSLSQTLPSTAQQSTRADFSPSEPFGGPRTKFDATWAVTSKVDEGGHTLLKTAPLAQTGLSAHKQYRTAARGFGDSASMHG